MTYFTDSTVNFVVAADSCRACPCAAVRYTTVVVAAACNYLAAVVIAVEEAGGVVVGVMDSVAAVAAAL